MSKLQPRMFLAALLALPLTLAAQQPPAPAAGKTADQVYKNIQVFKGLPASELIPTMQFMASSLGVECSFCHAQPFSADIKPAKTRARGMIRMVFAINKSTFNGRPEVNCYTCHQGRTSPNSQLALATLTGPAPGAPGEGGERGGPEGRRGPEGRGGPGGRRGPGRGPAAQTILDKYIQALGGAGALAGIHSEVITATRIMPGNRTMDEQVLRTGDKFIVSDGTTSKSGFDGSEYFSWNPAFGKRAAEGAMATQIEADAGMYPGANLKAAGARVFGPVPMGAERAYVMIVPNPAGIDRYFFDATSGLLVRVMTGTPTFLGMLPLQIDYSDYRTVDGVKLPFDITFRSHQMAFERKISSIQLNAAVPANAFDLPAGTGRRGFRGGPGRRGN